MATNAHLRSDPPPNPQTLRCLGVFLLVNHANQGPSLELTALLVVTTPPSPHGYSGPRKRAIRSHSAGMRIDASDDANFRFYDLNPW